MNTVEDFVSQVEKLYDRSQPWLTRPIDERRPDNPRGYAWGSSVLRRGKDGRKIRVPGIESVAVECQRKKVFSLYGIVGYKVPQGVSLPQDHRGNIFNQEIDEIMSNRSPFGNFVPGSKKVNYTDWRGEIKQGRAGMVFLNTKWFEMADGKKRNFFTGEWDFLNTTTNELVELKSLPEGWEVPTEPGKKAYRQVCTYLHAYKKAKGCWIIYIPQDLTKLDSSDPSTYSAFYVSLSEAEEVFNSSIQPLLEDVIDNLAWVKGNVDTFYRLIHHYPKCDDSYCCDKADEFLSHVDILPDWTIKEKS